MESVMAASTQSDAKKTKSASTKSTSSKSAGSKSAPSKSKSTAKKTGRTKAAQTDLATKLLMADHRAVEKLFAQYEKAKEDDQQKQQIFQQIAMELKVHTQIEEEIFYPASREHVKEEDIVNEAEVEHASAKDLIKQLEGMEPSDPYYDAKVSVLKEMIEHHVEEEETEYFPEVRKSDMDLETVGQQLQARKEELMGELGGDRLAKAVLQAACDRQLTLATAESCTGGLLASLLTDLPGLSHAFERGFVTYTDEAKHEMLGVPEVVLREDGAVSERSARAMAEGALAHSRADVCVSITGFAEGGPGQPAGLVHFGCARHGSPTLHRREQFGDCGRAEVRLQALKTALELLLRQMSAEAAAA
jgi:nicotinamide-nucleotide amidase